MFSCEFCKILKYTFLIEHLRATASIISPSLGLSKIYVSVFSIFFIKRNYKSSPSEVFLRKSVLKICSKFTGEHPFRSVISIKLICNFIKIALRHGCSANLLQIFRTPFPKNTSGGLLLELVLRSSHSFSNKH